jgi:hypothetical protein
MTGRRITFQRVLGSIENIFVHEVLSDKRRLFVVARQLLYEQQIYMVPVDTISGREQWAMQALETSFCS